jgi:outer membrane protein assembly factor BamB
VNWFTRSAPPPAPLAEIRTLVATRVLGRRRSAGRADAVFTPAVAAGSVYAASADGLVTRLDAATGKQDLAGAAPERARAVSAPMAAGGGRVDRR